MIISTSSYNVQLTDATCEYVESALRDRLGRVATHVVSIDARLEAVPGNRGRHDFRAILRVDLRNHRALVTEIQDDNLYAAIRRGARDAARAVDRQLQHSRKVTGQRLPGKFSAFGRYPATNP